MTTIQLQLTPREAQGVIDLRLAQLTPAQILVRPSAVRPLSVMIGGTPGSGKSTIQSLIQQSLGSSSVAVSDPDEDLPAHPRYEAIMRAHGFRAPQVVRQNLPSDLGRRCLDHLCALRCDVITSAPFEQAGSTTSWAGGFADVDYGTVLVYVVTPEELSGLGRADRYQRAVDDVGYGRWADSELCIRCDAEIPGTAGAIEAASGVDHLYATDRNGYVLYENHRGEDGLMAPPYQAGEAILAEYNRPPTLEEHAWFVATAEPLLNRNDLAQPVADLVQWAWDRHQQRPAPQPVTREQRLDQSLIDLRRVASSGVARPQVITSATSVSRSSTGRASGSRSLDR